VAQGEPSRPVLRIHVLGELQVWRDGEPVPLGSVQQRAVLGLLALACGRPVSRGELIDLLWPEHPPPTAVNVVQTHVKRLRRALEPERSARAPSAVLPSVDHGYALRLDSEQLDLSRFRRMVDTAHAARRGGDAERALALLEEALRIWRGPPLADVGFLADHPVIVGLTGERWSAFDVYADAAVEAGRAAEVVVDVEEAARSRPLDELAQARLVRTYRALGRRGDAVAAFQAARTRLVDALGVGPGRELTAAYLDLLKDEPDRRAGPARTAQAPTSPSRTTQAAAGPTRPAQLPGRTPVFVGRAAELTRLEALTRQDHRRDGPVIALVVGPPGVGKTALALHAAWRVVDRFPDGQLFVDLRGFARGTPVEPAAALTGFLRAFGVPDDSMPAGPAQLGAMFRSEVARRRVIIVLDNAAAADQVRPLLPGSGESVVIVTSRHDLRGLVALHDAHHLPLGPLSRDDSVDLLARLLPAAENLRELADACGRLPLALRIAAANIRFDGDRVLDYVARLRRADGLDALAVADDPVAAVRAAFDLSYAALQPAARRLFRLVAAAPCTIVSIPAAAALVDADPATVARLLEHLAEAHLIERSPAGPAGGDPTGGARYAVHDLVRVYAAERATVEDPPAEREAAIRRLFAFYLSTVRAAATALGHAVPEDAWSHGPARGELTFGAASEALAWLDGERANLVAVAQHAATAGPVTVSWQLALPLRGYFWMSGRRDGWLAIGHAGLDAARRAGDQDAEAEMLNFLGTARMRLSEYDEAAAHYESALVINKAVNATVRQAANLSNLGGVYLLTGRIDQAIENVRQSIELYRPLGLRRGEANAALSLANLYRGVGRLADAEDCVRQSLATYREQDFLDGQVSALHQLSAICRHRGRLPEALDAVTQARAGAHRLGTPSGAMVSLEEYLRVLLDAGRTSDAYDLVAEALRMIRETGDRQFEGSMLQILGAIALAGDDRDAARRHLSSALDLGTETGNVHVEVAARLDLAQLSVRDGADPTLATDQIAGSRRAAEAAGLRLLCAFADTVTAEVALAGDAVDVALAAGHRALEFHERGQVVPWIARTLLALSDAAARAGDTRRGAEFAARATRLIADFDLPNRPGAAGL